MAIPATFTNYVLNPSTVPNGSGAETRRNLFLNPAMAASTTQVELRKNEILNQSFEWGPANFDWTDQPWVGLYTGPIGAQSGARALKIVPTGVGGANDTYVGSSAPGTRSLTLIPNGTSVTVSGTITLTAAQLGSNGLGGGLYRPRSIHLMTRAGGVGAYTEASSGSAPNSPGTYRLSATITIATGSGVEFFMRLYNGSSNTADIVYWDDIEVSRTAQTAIDGTSFFDGSTPPFITAAATKNHSWTGTAYQSAALETAYTVPTYTATANCRALWTNFQAWDGLGALGVDWTGTSASMAAGAGVDITLPAATQYTFSCYVYIPSGGAPTLRARASGPGMTTVDSATVSTTNSWQRVSVTFTTVTAGTYNLSIRNFAAVNISSGAIVTDSWQLEVGPSATSWFSGEWSAPNLSYAWAGTPHNSQSVESGLFMPGYTGANASVVAATAGGVSRVGIIPTSASTDSKAYIEGGPGALRLGMLPGKTYYLSARLHLPSALTGTAGALNTRNMTVYTKVGAAAVQEQRTTTTANTAGSTNTHTMTFTVPSGATEAYISLNNGHPTGGGTAMWDQVMLTEAEYVQRRQFMGDMVDLPQVTTQNSTASASVISNVTWTAVVPSSTNNDSYVRWHANTAGAFPLDVQPGRSYTINADCRLTTAVMSGTVNANARRIVVIVTTPSGSTTYTSSQAANTINVTNALNVSFTTPANMTGIEVRLYNGAPNTITTQVLWNRVTLTETTLPSFGNVFFDGSVAPVYPKRISRWLGPNNYSRSEFLFRGLWIEGNTAVSPPRVQLTVAGLGLGIVSSVTLRRKAGPDTMAVAGWANKNVVDIGVATDWLVPLNTSVEYQLWVDGVQIDSETISFPSPCGWIADPLIPTSAMPVYTVPNGTDLQLAKAAMTEKTYRSERTMNQVVGSPWPLARASQRTLLQGMNLSLQAPSNVTSDQLYEMIRNAPILCVRTHPSWGNVPPVLYFACDVTERPLNRQTGGQFTVWDITGDVVMPLIRGPVVAAVTHAEVQASLNARTHQSIQNASSSKRWVDIMSDPMGLGT